MSTVHIAEKKIWVDDVAIPLLSGEIHYWRLDPANWRPVLQRAREMGLQVIATYVCWDFHEIEPGRYDFRGETDPRRDLLGFLDLLTAEGFWIILRPGPYIYSEWRNNGVPDDAARLHRLDPAFRARALPYMHAVVEAVCPYLATHGGRIILWQAENEIDPWLPWYTEQLGLGQQIGPFHDFLSQRYGDVDSLNAAWGTEYASVEEGRAVSEMFPTQPDLMRRYLDFVRFQHWYVTRVAAWAVKTYRDYGVDVPIYLNAYSGLSIQPWAELESLGDLAGPDIYPSRELALRPDEHRNVLEMVRYTRTYSCLPYIPEFKAGIWHDWLMQVGILPPNHYRMICLSALLAGGAGWNWYMLVNRDNWYQCPINEWGRVRPDLFKAFQQVTALYAEIDPASLDKLTDTAVTVDALQRGTQRPGVDLLRSLYQADIDYQFYDVDRAGCDQPLLLYGGGDWLSAAAQKHLKEYVEAGGHLVCIGAYPRLDDNLRPLNLLEIKDPSGIVSGSPGDLWLEVLGRRVKSPWAFNYAESPGTPIIATLPWQFNEPYPMAACTSAVDYYARPKPAYYAVARTYAPLLVSAKFSTLAWDGCEHFEAEAWVCNSHEQPYQDVTLCMRLIGVDGRTYAERIGSLSFDLNCAAKLAILQAPLKGLGEDVFFLDLHLLDHDGAPLSRNRYTFSRTSNLAPLLTRRPTTLAVSSKTNGESESILTLANNGETTALFLWLEDARDLNATGYAYFDDNYFCLLPKESRAVRVTWTDVPAKDRRLEHGTRASGLYHRMKVTNWFR